MNKLIFLTVLSKKNIHNLKKIFDKEVKLLFIDNEVDLINLEISSRSTLISFKTSIKIPKNILEKFNGYAYNLHEAPPEYPGRDPHHFGLLDNEKSWGATFHRLSERIDEGEILDVERFKIKKSFYSEDLIENSYQHCLNFLRKYKVKLCNMNKIIAKKKFMWGKKKSTRKQFLDLCVIDVKINNEKYKKIQKATFHSQFNNLKIKVNGDIFEMTKDTFDKLKKTKLKD